MPSRLCGTMRHWIGLREYSWDSRMLQNLKQSLLFGQCRCHHLPGVCCARQLYILWGSAEMVLVASEKKQPTSNTCRFILDRAL